MRGTWLSIVVTRHTQRSPYDGEVLPGQVPDEHPWGARDGVPPHLVLYTLRVKALACGLRGAQVFAQMSLLQYHRLREIIRWNTVCSGALQFAFR